MKLLIYACFLIITSFTNLHAQFVGYYSLKDGGVDIQSSTLFVLADHTFMVFYVGGNPLQGTWIEETKDKIRLETSTENKSIFSVYAISGNQSKKDVQFSPNEKLNIFVSFSKDTSKQLIYKSLFDENWSCLDRNFETNIPDKNGELILVSPQKDADLFDEIKYPVTSNAYTFKLSDKFSNYRIFIDGNVKKPFRLVIKKNKKNYIIEKINGSNPRLTERNDLTENILEKINDAFIPWQMNDLMKKGIKVQLLNPIKVEKKELKKPISKPLFVAKCE